jgi:hypothetical protein
MSLSTGITRRDFTGTPQGIGLDLRVNSMNWNVFGGAREASITAFGEAMDLWAMLEMLRSPVKIVDERGYRAWWGYVHEARVREDAIEVGVTLDTMNNAVAVAYSYVAPGSNVVGQRRTTTWATDTLSIAEFGRKDFLSSQDGMSDAAANARRDAILARTKWPQGIAGQMGGMPRGRVSYSGAKKSLSGTLYCRGWWETLRWRMASVAGTADTATTTQIIDLVTTYGSLITGTAVEAASGISSNQYRNGETDVLTEVMGLMSSGGANGRRLLGTVDVERRLWVYEEPASSQPEYSMDSRGLIYHRGVPINEVEAPVGKWLQLQGVVPASVDQSKMISANLQFVEGANWSEGEGLKLQYRGQPSIEDMFKLKR